MGAVALMGFADKANDLHSVPLYASANLSRPHTEPSMKVTFKHVESEHIKKAFLKVFRSYDVLHSHEIVLIQKPVKRSTMQAQPVVGTKGLFSSIKRYKVVLSTFVKDTDSLRVADLPEEVLVGWFAHELGHLVDYERFSRFGMLRFGLRYLTSARFKQSAEHAADRVAISHGFHEEIIATKEFILCNDLMGEKYKAQIRRFYMSVEQVEMCVNGQPPIEVSNE